MFYVSNCICECLVQQTCQSETSKEFIGSNQIKFEDKLTKDVIVIKCRLLSARMLAKLFHRIASTDIMEANSSEQPINVIVNFLCTQINFKSGKKKFGHFKRHVWVLKRVFDLWKFGLSRSLANFEKAHLTLIRLRLIEKITIILLLKSQPFQSYQAFPGSSPEFPNFQVSYQKWPNKKK